MPLCPGMHGGYCEHCACTAGLATCSADVVARKSGYEDWTARKVNGVFGALPCWHKYTKTYWKATCWRIWRSSCWSKRSYRAKAVKNGATYGKRSYRAKA